MKIKLELIDREKLKPLFSDPLKLPFGRYFTDYMFTMEYSQGQGWKNPCIKPYQPLVLEPSANVFHYSQEVFEGQKAYQSKKGEILMFRPLENARRLNRSLQRMCMPEIDEGIFLQAECELLKLEKSGIHVAAYWTAALPRKELERKLHEAVHLARARLEQRAEFAQQLPAPGKGT